VAAIDTAFARFAGIDRADTSFAALMAAQERIPIGDSRNAFAAEFLRVQGLWEFLDPSPVTAAHRPDYRWLAQVYESVQPAGTSDALHGSGLAPRRSSSSMATSLRCESPEATSTK
jgi:type I restriction enzyme, R subunit